VTLGTPSNPWEYLVVDSTNVYWATTGQQILSCPIGGGCGTGKVVHTSPNGNIYGLATPAPTSPYNGFLYIATSNTGGAYLETVNKSTLVATSTLVNLASPVGLAFDSVNSWVYIADQGDGSNNGSLARVKPDGTQFGTVLGSLANYPSYPQNPAVDGTDVYVSVSAASGNVYFCSLTTGCGASDVALSALAYPRGLFSDGTNLWSTAPSAGTNTGAVYKCPVGTNCGTPTPIAAGQGIPMGIVADATHVYWMNSGSGQIMRCPVAGCGGNPTAYVSGLSGTLYPLAQDANAVYWLDSAGLRKVAK
jgi:hypothetical protein